jgi:hypothetical protein
MYRALILSVFLPLVFFLVHLSAHAAADLKLNPYLDYTSDSEDGPLITGDNTTDGTVHTGKPAYVIFTIHQCFNSKNQARRTVDLYQKYAGKVDFITVDLDVPLSKEQKELKDRFYRNYIPHVVVIDGDGNVLYNRSGEIGTDALSILLDKALKDSRTKKQSKL